MNWILLVVAHLLFVLLAIRPGVSSSRRLLAGAVALVVPIGGPILASLVRRARGGGMVLHVEPSESRRSSQSAADVRRAGELPPSLERLMSTSSEERLAALVRLSGRADATSVALLRWAVEHGPREVVLDSALTLEELDLRREKRLEAARVAFETTPTFDRAFAAAEAAASGVLTGLCDDASLPALAGQARDYFEKALALDPSRAVEVEERLARLELAAARPSAALEILNRLVAGQESAAAYRLQPLRDEAAFAARRFDLLSFASLLRGATAR